KGKPRKPEEGVARNCFAGIPLDTLCAHAEGLWCLTHDQREDDVRILKEAFGERLSVGVHRHHDGGDRDRVREAIRIGRVLGVPLCATNAVRYARREAKPVLDVLHCIRENITLDDAGRALTPNAEAHLKSAREMEQLFADHPEWLYRTRVVADACTFKMTELNYRFPCELEENAHRPEHERETPD